MKIGYFGLSHLGFNYLVATAKKGYKVFGYDKNKKLIYNINNNIKIFNEPYLYKNYKKYKKNISISNNINNFRHCKIIFISSDVKTNSSGKSDLNDIKKQLTIIKKKFPNKIVVIMSQVYPGFTKNLKWTNNNIFYQVETLVFGDAFRRALYPERIIIGTKNDRIPINNFLLKYYKSFKCPIIKTNTTTAEIAKIAINLYLISSISTTNLIAKIVKNLGADWKILENSLRLDKRIGKFAYLKPGLGISGGNLERDLQNAISIANRNYVKSNLFTIWKKISKEQKEWPYRVFKEMKLFKKNQKLGILGLAYKENTNSIKNSPSIELINKLKTKNIFVYDPSVKNINKRNLVYMKNPYEILDNSNILFIMTPWEEFQNLKLHPKEINKIKAIIDPYGIFKNYKNFKKIYKNKYFSLI